MPLKNPACIGFQSAKGQPQNAEYVTRESPPVSINPSYNWKQWSTPAQWQTAMTSTDRHTILDIGQDSLGSLLMGT